MEYELIQANENHINLLIKYKLNTILDYANNIDNKEETKINNYVKNKIPKQLLNYKLITVNAIIIGCLLIYNYKDGSLIDEIYIEKNFRNKKIGSSIINKILLENDIVYLWVYKENMAAIKLYKNLGFKIQEETESRYFMKCQRKTH